MRTHTILADEDDDQMPNNTGRNRRLEVFIGSTFREHKAERDELISAIYAAGHIPSGMELWDADSRPLEDTLRLKLEQCDVHVLLVGSDYGSLVPDDSQLKEEVGRDPSKPLSYTHWEYLKSEQDRRPLIAFVSDLDGQSPDDDDSLSEFRKQVTESRFCKHYTLGPIDLKGQKDNIACQRQLNALKLSKNVVSALNEINSNTMLAPESSGWIRADSDEAFLLREIQGNRFLKRIINRLRQFDVLTKRVLTAADEKAMAAELFWRSLTGPIRRSGRRNIFFESGSTLAFVTEEFEHYVLKQQTDPSEWRVWTNNVESFLQLALYTDVEVIAFPSAAPDPLDKYGAIFDRSFFRVGEAPPKQSRSFYSTINYKLTSRITESTTERKVINDTRSTLRQALKTERGGIVCVTASGLESEQNEEGHLWKNGPHTGSHANMLLKRSAYTTGEPTISFLHEDKIGKNFHLEKCYPVFLEDCTWEKFKCDYPVALCVGFRVDITNATTDEEVEKEAEKKLESMEKLLGTLGFTVCVASNYKQLPTGNVVGALICCNPRFSNDLVLSPRNG